MIQKTTEFLLLLFLITSNSAFAKKFKDYSEKLQEDSYCMVDLRTLHPTQKLIGMFEVNARADMISAMTEEQRKKYFSTDDHIVPLVIGPKGVPYLIDNHHLSSAILKTGESMAKARIVANWSDLEWADFWEKMKKGKDNIPWTYLKDALGNEITPEQIPESLTNLEDYPLRSLVWSLRTKGALTKVNIPFAEFKTAEFLRANGIYVDPKSKTFEQDYLDQLLKSIALVLSPKGAKLPGRVECSNWLRSRKSDIRG